MFAVAEESATIETFAVSPRVHPPTIRTLYDLIEAFQDQVAPEDDAAVTAAVAHLFNRAYVKFLTMSGECRVGKPLLSARPSRPRARRHKGVG
jgi:hypothetical protein